MKKNRQKLIKIIFFILLLGILLIPLVLALLQQKKENRLYKAEKRDLTLTLESEKQKMRNQVQDYQYHLTTEGKKESLREKLNLVEKGEIPVEIREKKTPSPSPALKEQPAKQLPKTGF